MWCSDPFVNYLKELGYSIVRLPRADIHPLEIYTERGKSLDYVGELATVFQAGDVISLPKVSKNIPASNISGRRTSSISSGIGLTMLGSILGAMGGSQLGLDVHYQQAKTVTFEFHEVQQDKIEPAQLDQYLTNASISPFSRHVRKLLDADKIYATIATLKSKKLTVEAKAVNNMPIELHVPSVQGTIGGNVTVSGQTEKTSKIMFEGKENLIFGFQAVQIFFLNGVYRAYEIVQPSGGMRGGERISSTVKMVESEGPFLRLNKHIDEVE